VQVIQGAYSRFEYGIKSEETRLQCQRSLAIGYPMN